MISFQNLCEAVDSRRGYENRELIFPVTAASLGATLFLVIAIFTVIIIKLHKDKANMRRLMKSMAVQSSSRIIIKRDIKQDYENIEICDRKAAAAKAVDIEVNENPAYSTVKDL